MTEVPPSRLQNFPISWFAVVMGMTGFTIAWHRAEILLGIPVKPSPVLLGLTIILFVVLLLLYLAKALKYPGQVKAEFAHPVKPDHIYWPDTFEYRLVALQQRCLPYGLDARRGSAPGLYAICPVGLVTPDPFRGCPHQPGLVYSYRR